MIKIDGHGDEWHLETYDGMAPACGLGGRRHGLPHSRASVGRHGWLRRPHTVCEECPDPAMDSQAEPLTTAEVVEEAMEHVKRPNVLLQGVAKLKVTTEHGQNQGVIRAGGNHRRIEIGRLSRIAYSGTANVVIEGNQGQMEMD